MPIIILYTAAMQGNRPIFCAKKTLIQLFTYHLKAHQTFSDWKRGSLIV